MALLPEIRRQLRRPLVVLGILVVGFIILFPHAGGSDITLRHKLPSCASSLKVSVVEDGAEIRSTTRLIEGQSSLSHQFLLPAGEYLLRIQVECRKGGPSTIERTLVADKSGSLDFDLSDACAC